MCDSSGGKQTARSGASPFPFLLNSESTKTSIISKKSCVDDNLMLTMITTPVHSTTNSIQYDNDVEDDVTEKYLTKSSKQKSLLSKKKSHPGTSGVMVQNEDLDSDFFEPLPDEDNIAVGDFGDQIVVTLLSSPAREDSSTDNEGSLSKLTSNSTGDIYLNATYTNDHSSHFSSPSRADNVVSTELHIESVYSSDDSRFHELDFGSVHFDSKKDERKQPHNKMGPLPATIGLMEDPVRNLWVTSKTHKEQLKECGHSWTTGMWSKEETRVLKDNISRYCMERGIEDPNNIIFQASKEERKDFYPTISNGLNRPLFSVYRRVKRLYDQKNHKGRYSREEVDKLKRLTKIHGRDWTTIARQLGRSSDSVKDRVRLFKDDLISGKWTEGEEERLAAAVHTVTRTKRGELVTKGIPWNTVADMVGNRTEKQCRTKWLNYLNWKLLRGKDWTKDDDRLLVQKIVALNPDTENDIDWNQISSGWSSVRSPTWLRQKWSDLKKILHECDLIDIGFTDTVKFLDKLFSEDIFKVWDKPKQLVKFLVGVQKARNISENCRKRIQTIKKKRTEDENEDYDDISTCIVHQPDDSSSAPLFIQSTCSDQMMTSELLNVPREGPHSTGIAQQSLNTIVRPRTESETIHPKNGFELPIDTEFVCEDGDESVHLPQGTYHLTPTSSAGVFVIQPADDDDEQNTTMTSESSRLVNITLPPDVLRSMMKVDEPTDSLSINDATDHEYLANNLESSDDPMLATVERDVTIKTPHDDDDVSMYVT